MIKKVAIYLVLLLIVAGLVFGVFTGIKKYRIASEDLIKKDLNYVSKLYFPLLEARLKIVEYNKLDFRDPYFLEQKAELLSEIESAQIQLDKAIEEQENNKPDNVLEFIARKVGGVGYKLHSSDYKIYSNFFKEYVEDMKKISAKTSFIYGIYFPSDYERYSIDFSQYYEGELQQTGLFTDVKESFEEIDKNKFDDGELINKLDSLQPLFEECIREIGKERVTFKDLGQCEDALSIDELKELAYHTEKTYYLRDSFLKELTDLSNDVLKLRDAVFVLSK